MIRRTFWFVVGAVAGAYAALWARKTVEDVSKNLTPSVVLEQLVSVAKTLARAAVSGVTFVIDSIGAKDDSTHP